MNQMVRRRSLSATASLLALLAPTAFAAAVADPWLAIAEDRISESVTSPQVLAGSWQVDPSVLESGTGYEMTFEVTEVTGRIGVFLGDNPCFVIEAPGRYQLSFNADDRKRMVFRALALTDGEARLVARDVGVRTLSQPALAEDPWLAVEEGWIWRTAEVPGVLAGSDDLSEALLPSGRRFAMTFNVTSVAGDVRVTLGDSAPRAIRTPGAYRYTFTADSYKRLLFEAVSFDGRRARLGANSIRVSVAEDFAEEDPPVRIAYSSDGNVHDADDWSASPLALALLAGRPGFELVHFDYNNHLGDNEPEKAAAHREIVREAAGRYGFEPALLFDDQEAASAATTSLAQQVNASTAEDRLYLICAGPMEMCWRGLDAAMDERLPHVTLITHSWWNNHHSDTAELEHTLDDISSDFPMVEILQIGNQNDTAFRSPREDWLWLQQHGEDGQWLYERITAGGRTAHPGDASDAGMVYFVIDGMRPESDRASMEDIRRLFNE